MTELKTVGVRDLKNKLSAYLRDVRAGVRVLVSDRGTVVAELREPLQDHPLERHEDPILSEWVRAGVVTPARVELRKLDSSPIRLPKGASLRLLDEERRETPR